MVVVNGESSRLLLQSDTTAPPGGIPVDIEPFLQCPSPSGCGINPCFGCIDGTCQQIPGCCLTDAECDSNEVCDRTAGPLPSCVGMTILSSPISYEPYLI